jgi:hypothetical protein
MSKPAVTRELLQSLFDYRPETGHFVRKTKTAPVVNVGDIAGGPDAHGYINISIGSYPYKAHRLAWLWMHGSMPIGHIDHINGKKDDNRIANLRDVTVSQNLMNSALSRANKTGHKGVWYDPKRNNWQAYITAGKKRIPLGRYDSPALAAEAYIEASKRHHGEFARTA